ncbi:coat protein [Atractylodes mottle virus]|uniref:Capsid protein n=1 Tax=Atractylodes mottle virus TaxID=1702121 RepID=A0A0K2BMK5_9VIRU|nr:coat protein [Atractylodes mottle virus]AKZ66618.1 coat protein [Atractylodes mottle virus]
MPPKPDPDAESSNAQRPPVPPPRPPAANAEEARQRLAEMERERNENLNERPPVTENEEDLQMISRLGRLADMLRHERSAIVVTNAALETGRPTLQPAENMRGDPTNIYSRVSTELLWRIKPKRVSNNIATAEEMIRIQIALEGHGIPTENVAEVILQMALICANTSSSSFQDPQGTIEWEGGGTIIVDDVVGTINEISTLRKVCRLYAAIVWNHMHIHHSPPADWAALGFHHSTRFAAFDFFDYVENNASIKPAGGVVPRPTRAEYDAYFTYKHLALNKANVNDTFANFDAQITGGRQGPAISTNFNNANNRSLQ